MNLFFKKPPQPSTELLSQFKLIEALNAALAVIEFRRDGTIINANEKFLKMMGYSFDEVQYQHHSMFVDEEYAQSKDYFKFWEDLNNGNMKTAQFKRLTKNKQVIWLEATYTSVGEGDDRTIIKIASDITQRMTDYNRYMGQINALNKSNAVIYFNLDGSIIDANEKFLGIMGYTIDEIKGRNHAMFVEPTSISTRQYKEFWDTLNRGEFVSTRCKRYTKMRKEIWFEATYNPILDENGKLLMVVKYAKDITASIQSQKNLRSSLLLPFISDMYDDVANG